MGKPKFGSVHGAIASGFDESEKFGITRIEDNTVNGFLCNRQHQPLRAKGAAEGQANLQNVHSHEVCLLIVQHRGLEGSINSIEQNEYIWHCYQV